MKLRICLFLLFLVPSAVSRGESPRLGYLVETLGDAQEVMVVAPGADGTGHAFLLKHGLGSWARFNWPSFEPLLTCDGVTFRARRKGKQPAALAARVLTEDGNEWQGRRIALTEDWQDVKLTAGDFRFFRGSEETAGETPDLGRVVQFQLVPLCSAREGTGELLVDDIRVSPDGPGWNAGGEELLPPADPFQTQWERVDDIVRRWNAERQRLEAESQRVDTWRAELDRLIADWAAPDGQAQAHERLASQSLPWQQPPQTPPALQDCSGVDVDTFQKLVASGQRAPRLLIEMRPGMKLWQTRLYAAPKQEPPEAVELDGETIVRHHVHFTEADVPQTVFTELPLPEAVDVDGQRVLMRMRMTGATLNEQRPLLLRLYTKAAEGGESWGDLTPVPFPDSHWAEVVFDCANPMRGARYTPGDTLRLAVRMENQPGVAAAFTLEFADIRVAPPDPLVRARRILLQSVQSKVEAARAVLYSKRNQVALREDALLEMPGLRAAYLASFETPLPREAATSSPPSPVLEGMTLPEGSLRPSAVRTCTMLVDNRPALFVHAPDEPADSELAVEMRDRAGTLQAAGRGLAAGITLIPAHAPAWAPGEPHVYSVRCVVRHGDRVTSSSERSVGMRTADVRSGGPDAVLRHAIQRRQLDWTYRLNGRCWFPRVSAYHWPDAEDTVVEGVRMFGDLWMDGVRQYGFSFRQQEWDRFSRYGLGMFTSLAPSYRSLRGWEDVGPWRDNYDRRCRLTISASDSPHQLVAQAGNEAELTCWGASLSTAFPDALYQPLDMAANQLRRVVQPTAPAMYVRAGTFRQVPPLPHEQVSGVNQYTGRYGGRVEDIDRNLAELARQALWADRPLMITEWMGPKYSWASTGVGGVTRRGAAYYLERYWRAMIDTPGIVGSSEFTLNWVIAPFEDLTNQSREQAWKNRPYHSPFGGGRTADHIPHVGPGDAVRSEPTFRAMQAFHGPLYIMANRPGPILIAGAEAEAIAAPLRQFRNGITSAVDPNSTEATGHVLRLLPAEKDASLPGVWDEPVFRTQIHPARPDCLLTSLHAASPEAAQRGIDRLVQAARALAELNRLEGAMTRAVALTDKSYVSSYENYLLEFAARGYLHCGDDVRLELDTAEFFAPDGTRRPAWQDLSAILLDTERTLSPDELTLLDRLSGEGANLIISVPCYAANPGLSRFIEAELTPAGTLADAIPLDDSIEQPVPVHDLGSVDIGVIETFRPDMARSAALDVFAIRASNAGVLATDAQQRPILVQQAYGKGRVALLGTSLGAAIEVHRRVTRAGRTHSIYDRDTACGLERLSRVVINLCRAGCQSEQHRPRLYIRMTPESTWVEPGEPVRISIALTDVDGTPIAGQLRTRLRTLALDERGGAGTEFIDLEPTAPGCYELRCIAEDASLPTGDSDAQVITFPAKETATSPRVLSLHFKAFAPDHIPADAAIAVLLAANPSGETTPQK